MAGDLPINSYDTFAQQQEDTGRNIYDFWTQQFQKFNPVAPQIQPQNNLGSFQQSGQKIFNQAKDLAGPNGAPGSSNIAGIGQRINNQENTRGLNENINNNIGAMDQNYQTNMRYGMGSLGRMNELGGSERRINELPVDREGQRLATNDTINSMENAYQNGKPDAFQTAIGAAGKIGGTLAGNALNGALYGQPSSGTDYGINSRNYPLMAGNMGNSGLGSDFNLQTGLQNNGFSF